MVGVVKAGVVNVVPVYKDVPPVAVLYQFTVTLLPTVAVKVAVCPLMMVVVDGVTTGFAGGLSTKTETG